MGPPPRAEYWSWSFFLCMPKWRKKGVVGEWSVRTSINCYNSNRKPAQFQQEFGKNKFWCLHKAKSDFYSKLRTIRKKCRQNTDLNLAETTLYIQISCTKGCSEATRDLYQSAKFHQYTCLLARLVHRLRGKKSILSRRKLNVFGQTDLSARPTPVIRRFSLRKIFGFPPKRVKQKNGVRPFNLTMTNDTEFQVLGTWVLWMMLCKSENLEKTSLDRWLCCQRMGLLTDWFWSLGTSAIVYQTPTTWLSAS